MGLASVCEDANQHKEIQKDLDTFISLERNMDFDVFIQVSKSQKQFATVPDSFKNIAQFHQLSHSKSGNLFSNPISNSKSLIAEKNNIKRSVLENHKNMHTNRESGEISDNNSQNQDQLDSTEFDKTPIGFVQTMPKNEPLGICEELGTQKMHPKPFKEEISPKINKPRTDQPKLRHRNDQVYSTEIKDIKNSRQNEMMLTQTTKNGTKRKLKLELKIPEFELLPGHNPDHIFLEGNLLKYHPGFSAQFVNRHCQITRINFCYYKDQFSAGLYAPIGQLKFSDIDSAMRISIDTQEKQLNKSEASYKYRFEIFVKSDYWANKTQKNYKFNDSIIKKSSNLTQQNLKSSKKPHVDKVSFEDDNEAKEYINYVKMNGVKIVAPLKTTFTRRFSTTARMKGTSPWINREIEWFTAEERFVFCTRTLEECERWVLLINWIKSKDKI